MPRTPFASTVLLAAVLGAHAGAQTTGLTPVNDLGPGLYQGFPGGLYPGGVNSPPASHLNAAMAMAGQVVARNASGQADPDGLIVMIAVGMSNTTHEFAVFERDQDANPGRNARVVLVDTALGGQAAAQIAPPTAAYWTVMQQRLDALGLTAAQVQVAWLKQAEMNPLNNFPLHAQGLRNNLELIANNLHDRFPNLRLCYLSSRIYGGYATGTLNPEPQAYESGFSVKWLIEDQINGDTGLNYGQLPGAVRSPLLLWGPYLWADGTTPRSDGLVFVRADLESDGTHPAPSGEQKVASMLSSFFAAEPTAQPWWPRQPDARLVTIDATDDAYVYAANPGGNFGAASTLLTLGSPSPQNTYLKFVTGPGLLPARLAKLSLRVSQNGGGGVSLVNDSAWTQGSITFANAPAFGAPFVLHPQASRDGTFASNVAAQVNADPDGVVSFALTSSGTGARTYLSREGGQSPRLTLIVTTPCPADYNQDGFVDGLDYDLFNNDFESFDPSQQANADYNGDGFVDGIDYDLFVADFERAC